MFIRADFEENRRKNSETMAQDFDLRKRALDLTLDIARQGYVHQWTWLNLPIIQLPADVLMLQEIVWETKPDFIIETGIAWGGSVLFYASLCQLLDKGEVVAVDVKLMDHVKTQIMSYPFSNRIHLYNGSSTDPAIAEKIKSHVKPGHSVMVVLDSSHTHEHVLAELKLYASLVTKGQYLVVCDTYVEDSPPEALGARPWGPGNNSRTALLSYLKEVDRFVEDRYIKGKAVISLLPNGYLRCIK